MQHQELVAIAQKLTTAQLESLLGEVDKELDRRHNAASRQEALVERGLVRREIDLRDVLICYGRSSR